MLDPEVAYRKAVLASRAGFVGDLLPMRRMLNIADISGSAPDWIAAIERQVAAERAKQIQLAGEFYDSARTFAGVPGSMEIVAAEWTSVDEAALRASLEATGLAQTKSSIARGASAEEALNKAFVRTAGVAARTALDGGRKTIIRTALADPASGRWRRVGSGKACTFCRMLIGRGFVYREATATFRTHDHCACTAEPGF